MVADPGATSRNDAAVGTVPVPSLDTEVPADARDNMGAAEHGTQDVGQDTKDMTDIQALIEHFNSLPAGSSLHMEQQSLAMVSKPLSSDNAGFLLGNPAIVPVAQAVTKANVETGLFQLQDGVPESNICHISGSNKTLSDLTMEMMSGDELQCLVLERCNGVSLCDTIFKGGLFVLTGQTCNASFDRCNFERCTLVVLNGAKANLEECLFSSCSNLDGSNGVCLYSHGTHTRVHIQDCKFAGGLQCIVACEGAHVIAKDVCCTGADVCAVEGSGTNSKIELENCTVLDMGHAYANLDRTPNHEGKVDFLLTGVHVHNFCRAELTLLSVSTSEIGISVDSGATCAATECDMFDCVACSANVSHASTASFTKCTMKGSQLFHGLHVDGMGTSAKAHDCIFEGNKQSGAGVYGGSHIQLIHCQASANEASGYWAQGGGHMVLLDCTSTNDAVGCGGIEHGSSLKAERLQVSSSSQSGVVVDQEAKATVTESVVCDCVQACMMISAGAQVELTETRLERAKKGHGMEVTGDGSRVSAERCVFRDNTEAGAAVFKQGLMELTACESERNEVAGFWSQNGGEIKLSDCVSSKDEVGCGVRGEGSTADCHNMSVSGNSLGFLVIAGGTMEVHNGIVTGSTSSGVSCSDMGSRFSMFGSQVKDCVESGVCAQDGGRVTVKHVRTSGNKLCSFICNGEPTRMVLVGCMSTDETPYMGMDNGKLISRGCYPRDTTDDASVFRKFKDLDIT